MIKKTITYKNYDNQDKTIEAYFNLNKVEVIDMEVGLKGGLNKYIDDVVKTEDRKALVNFFEDLISKSYGVKSEDGNRFEKSPEKTKAFIESEAYVELFMELANDVESAKAFISGVFPPEFINK